MTDLERLKWPDPVLRVKDEMDLHALAQAYGYAVFSMADGRPVTHDTYPSRAAARRFAERKTHDLLLILEVQPDGMTYKEANAVLIYERTLNNMGIQSPDSLEDEANSGALSMPANRHDRRRMAIQLKRGTPLYPPHVSYGNLPQLIRKVR
jgi:hypothetical protein